MSAKAVSRKFAICKCFYERNIFVKQWNAHVTFRTDEQFELDYGGQPRFEEVLQQVKNEITRRHITNCVTPAATTIHCIKLPVDLGAPDIYHYYYYYI